MNMIKHLIERVRDLIEERHDVRLFETWRDERLALRHKSPA